MNLRSGKLQFFRKVLLCCTGFLFQLPAVTAQAESLTVQHSIKKHPKVCLALSGGGARGFAHIGVLKKLEEMRIPVDCIAGTSMGAVIGGLYASGLSASEIEKRIAQTKLNDVALDRVDRRIQPQSIREEDEQYPLGATLGVSANGVRLPAGVVQANQFQELIQNWTSHLAPDLPFDRLPIPFRAVATDLETGQMVVFDKGPLHKAIRASMAAPGVFAPTEIDGRLLADGGLVKNLPVDIAREMGADVIIAVNIGTPLLPRDKLQTLFSVSQQMINILTEQNVEAQKKLIIAGNDILIEPDLGDIGFMDFGRARDAIQIGENAAIRKQAFLTALAVPEHVHTVNTRVRENTMLRPVQISFVEIENDAAIPVDDIRRQLGISTGEFYVADDINRKLTELNSRREFDSVSHELVQKGDEYGVKIKTKGKNWGPHFLRFGLSLSSGFDGAGGYRLQVGHRRPWLTEGGLEWRNDAEFGNVLKLRSELRQPLYEREGMYLAPFAEFSDSSLNYYREDVRLAEYSLRTERAGIELAIPLGVRSTLGEARIGLNFNSYRVSPKLGGILIGSASDPTITSITNALPQATLQQFGLKTGFVIDQLSDPAFPREGYKVESSLFIGLDGSHQKFQELSASGLWAASRGNHSLNLKISAAGLFQSDVTQARGVGSFLGGFQKLTAYQQDQFVGNYMLYGSATYLLRAVNFEMAGQSLFLGTSVEAGQAWNERKEYSPNNMRKSISVFTGVNSFLGPLYLGFAVGQNGAKNIFFQLGKQTDPLH